MLFAFLHGNAVDVWLQVQLSSCFVLDGAPKDNSFCNERSEKLILKKMNEGEVRENSKSDKAQFESCLAEIRSGRKAGLAQVGSCFILFVCVICSSLCLT
jgi:hypothetical protein